MKIKYTLLAIVITFSLFGFSQKLEKKVTITIMVKDSLDKAVHNAIVFLDDVKNRKTTNKKGELKIKVKELPTSISAYSENEGFESIVFKENNKVTITFTKESLTKGDYIELLTLDRQKKVRKTKHDQYFATIYDYLRAKAPMLKISSDNQIRIRGYDISFNGSSEPLFIVNGSPTSVISSLVPSNIKSVSVLKDSSAASYGVRGANGVIIITTN